MSVQDTSDQDDDETNDTKGSSEVVRFESRPSTTEGLSLVRIFEKLSPHGRTTLLKFANDLLSKEGSR